MIQLFLIYKWYSIQCILVYSMYTYNTQNDTPIKSLAIEQNTKKTHTCYFINISLGEFPFVLSWEGNKRHLCSKCSKILLTDTQQHKVITKLHISVITLKIPVNISNNKKTLMLLSDSAIVYVWKKFLTPSEMRFKIFVHGV